VLCYVDYHVDLVRTMWQRGESVRHTYLYHAMTMCIKGKQSTKLHNVMEVLRDTELGVDEET